MNQKKEPAGPPLGGIAEGGKKSSSRGNTSKKKPIALPAAAKLQRDPHSLLRLALIVAAYLFAFILLDFITKQFEELPGIVAWYPPAGLTYTLLLVFGLRFAPAVTIVLFISSLFIYRMPQPPYLLFLWALIISLIYGGAAAFLRKRIHFDWHLRKLRDVTWFVFTALFVSALLAVLSVTSSALSSAMPRSEVLRAIFDWWIGETVGVLSVTPFLLIYGMPWLKRFAEGQPVRLPARWSFPRPTLSAIGQAVSIALTLYWVFGTPVLDEFRPLFLIALPLIWIALQRGFKGVSAAILAVNSGVVLALWLFRFDLARLGELELLMIVNCIVGLLMGAVVTERKQAEEELKKSEGKFRAIFDNASTGMFIVDLKAQKFFMCNSTCAKMLGYAQEEFLNLDIADIHPGEDIPFINEQILKFSRGEEGVRSDIKFKRKNGSIFASDLSPALLTIADKEYLHISFIDITEREQAEKALQESEERYRQLLEFSPDAIVVHSDGKFVYVNPAAVSIYGAANSQELLGKPMLDRVHSDYRKVVKERVQRLNEGKGAALLEEKLLQLDGSEIEVEVAAIPITYQGKPAVQMVIRDITERKQREEQMARLNMAVDHSGEAVFMTDREGVITFVNPGFTQLYGYTADEIVGETTPRILKSGVLKPEDYAAFWQILLNKQVVKGELINKTKDGSLLNIENWSSPILNQQGEVIGFLSLQRDITDRKQREEEIRSRSEELTTLYQLSRLLADASDLESVFELVNRHAVESVHITFACLALLENGELVTRAVYPVRVLDHEFAIGDRHLLTALPVCQRVLDKNEPVILQAGSPEVGSLERLTLHLDFARSVCLVPLRVGGASQGLSNALGLLILGEARQEKRESFTSEKIHLARSIGDQAAAAIRRLLLHEQAGRRLQQLASLSEIDRTIASSFDLRLSLQMILRHVSEQLKVDAADVLVLNDRLHILEFTAGRGYRTPAMESMRQQLGEGQAGRALLERQIVQIPDVAASGAVFAHPELLEAENAVAYYAVPLIVKGKVMGVLEICNRTPLNPNAEWLDFLKTLAGQAAIAIDNVQLVESLQRSTDELELAYDATIEGWSHALDLRDKETEGHTQRVTEMTVNLARSLGLGEETLVQVRWGALLHDIGKMGVPDGILLKPGPLTAEEWVVMKKHPTFAYEMLSPIRYLRLALDIPYCHHEKWDGSGYPRGLKGEQIPLVARIFAVVDVWDALISDRPYRLAWPEEKARQLIKTGAGTHFDPQVVKEFLLESG